MRIADGFTGSVYWTSSQNGFTLRPVGEIARYLYDEAAAFGELTGMFTPQLLRTGVQVDGAEASVLRLTSPIGYPIDVYVDPQTGAYRRIVIDPDGKYASVIDGIAYTTIGSRRFISAWHDETSTSTYTYTSIEPNAAPDADELRPPKQIASWTFGAEPAKIESTDGNVPRIDVDASDRSTTGRSPRAIPDRSAATRFSSVSTS